MDIMDFHLGLQPPMVRSDFVPRREVAAIQLLQGKELAKNEGYIGDGHFPHRWTPPMWSNPFRKGRHGSSLEVVLKHIQWVVQLTSAWRFGQLHSALWLRCQPAMSWGHPAFIDLASASSSPGHDTPTSQSSRTVARWHCWRGAPGWSRPSLFNSRRQKSLWHLPRCGDGYAWLPLALRGRPAMVDDGTALGFLQHGQDEHWTSWPFCRWTSGAVNDCHVGAPVQAVRRKPYHRLA